MFSKTCLQKKSPEPFCTMAFCVDTFAFRRVKILSRAILLCMD